MKGTSPIYFSSDQKKQIYISGSFTLFIMGAIVVSVWLIFRRLLADLGLTQPVDLKLWWWMPIVFMLIYLLDAVITLSTKKRMDTAIDEWKKRTPFLPTKTKELPEYLLMCFSAGVFEEIVYRGYLVTYCWYLFEGSTYHQLFAITVPALAFAVAHFYQGARAVLKIFVLSLFFGYIFVYSGSLLIVMILHFLVDAIGGLLSIKFMKDEEIQQPGDEDNFLQ